jgi:hypothetical protein
MLPDTEVDKLKLIGHGPRGLLANRRMRMRIGGIKQFVRWLVSVALVLALAPKSYGYAAFAHLSIVEASWDKWIAPCLKKKFPKASEAELKDARAYAYGGCLIQDMGYFPGSNHLFSDLTHYVRSGDFVQALLSEAEDAKDLNGYAFALGALAHYVADSTGHPLGTNHAVAVVLKKGEGSSVTYEQNAAAHKHVEFGFDITDIADRVYGFDTQQHFREFQVCKSILQRAFKKTYGVELGDVLPQGIAFIKLSTAESISIYRFIVTRVMATAEKLAWDLKQEQIKRYLPNVTGNEFTWASSWRTVWLDYMICLPCAAVRDGYAATLEYEPPTPTTDKLFEDSLKAVLSKYQKLIRDLAGGKYQLTNLNLDTGNLTNDDSYGLTNTTYCSLLKLLATSGPEKASVDLRTNLLTFYGGPGKQDSASRCSKEAPGWLEAARKVAPKPSN